MDFDEYTNTLLPYFKDQSQYPAALIERKLKIEDYHRGDLLVRYMEDKGLIIPEGPKSETLMYLITPFGMQVLQMGGWYKYLETKKAEAKKESQRKELEYQQLDLQIKALKKDLRNNKLWWMAGAGLVSLVVSLISNNLEFILKFLGLIEAK